jgi:hypothetical protein
MYLLSQGVVVVSCMRGRRGRPVLPQEVVLPAERAALVAGVGQLGLHLAELLPARPDMQGSAGLPLHISHGCGGMLGATPELCMLCLSGLEALKLLLQLPHPRCRRLPC